MGQGNCCRPFCFSAPFLFRISLELDLGFGDYSRGSLLACPIIILFQWELFRYEGNKTKLPLPVGLWTLCIGYLCKGRANDPNLIPLLSLYSSSLSTDLLPFHLLSSLYLTLSLSPSSMRPLRSTSFSFFFYFCLVFSFFHQTISCKFCSLFSLIFLSKIDVSLDWNKWIFRFFVKPVPFPCHLHANWYYLREFFICFWLFFHCVILHSSLIFQSFEWKSFSSFAY